jgi:hypothetical protein
MLEKLATHDMDTISTLFALADKCAKASRGPCMALGPANRGYPDGWLGYHPLGR